MEINENRDFDLARKTVHKAKIIKAVKHNIVYTKLYEYANPNGTPTLEYIYVCPNCGAFTSISLENVGSLESIIWSPRCNATVKPIAMDFSVMCDDCGEYMFQCDQAIYTYIIKMIVKGYQTMYCCEGHLSDIDDNNLSIGDYNSIPYINFNTDDNAKRYIREYMETDYIKNKYPDIRLSAQNNVLTVHMNADGSRYELYTDSVRIDIEIPIDALDDGSDEVYNKEFLRCKEEFINFLEEFTNWLPDKNEDY